MMNRLCRTTLSVAAALGALTGCSEIGSPSSASGGATSSTEAVRITSKVDDGDRTSLPASLHPLIRSARDLGRVDGATVLHGASLVFNLTPSARADLDALLAQQQDPASPAYHRWLTPEQYADRFGMPPADLAKVEAWLASQGLTVERTARSRTRLFFGGTVSRLERAFRTELHRYDSPRSQGEERFAMASPPSVPSAFAGRVTELHGLSDFRRRPLGHLAPRPLPPPGGAPLEDFVNGSHAMAPEDFAKIYGVDKLYAAGFTGTGATIAVVAQTYYTPADIAAFRQTFSLPAASIDDVLVPNTGGAKPLTPSDYVLEAELDLEWAGAVAKNATVVFVYTGGATNATVDDAKAYAIDQALSPFVSESYGGCELTEPAATIASEQALVQQANAQGITVLAGSGDWGAASCDETAGATQASAGFAVAFPASIPEVTAVGGTTFNEAGGTYWSAQNDAAYGSVLSYIPEKTWDDIATAGSLKNAGGGGRSSAYAKPSWQAGVGVPADGQRDVPDVALAASQHDGYVVYLGTVASGSTAGTYISGGTSAATPTFAAIMALVSQATNAGSLGNINARLYQVATTTPAVFHDVTTGDNDVPCVPGSTSCPATAPYQFGYSAGVGYDLVTGLGSVDALALSNAWGAPTHTTLARSGAGSLLAGAPFGVTATVTTSSATVAPSGSVTFYNGAVVLGTGTLSAAATGTGGDYVGTATANVTLPGGTFPLTARFSGDLHYAPSTGGLSSPVVVGAWPTVTTMGSLPSSAPEGVELSASVTSGAPATLAPMGGTLTFFSGGASVGTVFLTLTPTDGGAPLVTGALPKSSVPVGADSITAKYSGDGNYLASTSSADAVTVDATLVVTPSPAGAPPRGQVAFVAAAGVSPVAWTLQTNASGGTIDPSTGAYVAGATPGVTDVVLATDSAKVAVTVDVTVGPGVSITPAAPSVPPRGTVAFAAKGGSGAGYLWTVTSSIGSQVTAAGAYTAGASGGATDDVVATDPLGNTATVHVTVTGGEGDAGGDGGGATGRDAAATFDAGGPPGDGAVGAAFDSGVATTSVGQSSGGCALAATGGLPSTAWDLALAWLVALVVRSRRRSSLEEPERHPLR